MNKDVTGVAPETMETFIAYPWTGNVRELENCMERAFVVCKDSEIFPEHLPPEIATYTRDDAPPPERTGRRIRSRRCHQKVR